MIKQVITALFFLITGIGTVSAQTNGLGKNDPDAKKILDGVSAKFKTLKSVEAKFVLKIESTSGKLLGTKAGTVYMKGLKYHVSIPGQEIFCDGTNVSTYDQSTNEVTITKLDPTTNTLTPQKIFTDFYNKDFLYKLNGEKKVGNKTLDEIELTPVDKSKPYFKVIVNVDKLAKTISSLKIFEKAGNRITYTVSSFNSKAVIPEGEFAFDAKKYPGVEVVDLR